MADTKNKILSIRLNDGQESYIENAIKALEKHRGVGAKKVTKTETVYVLLAMGMESFNKKYGNPIKKTKKVG